MVRLKLFLSAAILVGATDVMAAGAPPASDTVETVVVTSRKVAENIQDTPISVTALSAAELERTGVKDLAEVAKRTPGLQYGDYGDLKLSPTSLRGVVSSSGSAGADPAVGYYVDEIYVGQGVGANLDLADVARVEVLRGPQGTLYGRNTIGGVISTTTERPTNHFSAEGSASFGNYNAQRYVGLISGPLVEDHILGKISAVYNDRDGYENNIYLHNKVNDQHNWSTRGELLFLLAPKTELALTADYRSVDQHPLVFETVKYNMAASVPGALVAFGFPLNTNTYDHNVISNIVTHETLSSSSFGANFKTQINGVNIINIFGYHQHSYYDIDDTCRCQLKIAYDGDPEHVIRASDELRIDGKFGKLTWLVGGYYFHQNTNNQSFVIIGSDLASFLGAPSLSGIVTGSNGRLATASTAVFFSGDYAFTDQFDVTVGGRYTRDAKHIHYTQADPVSLLGGNADITASDAWSKFTPNLNARYKFSPDVLGYVTVSQGFKSGGYNDALGDANGIAFGPEMLWNYEAGLKSTLFDRRLVLNVSAFHMKWTKIQITMQNPATTFYDPIILNAGAAHSDGVEAEFIAKPWRHFQIGGNLYVADTGFDEGRLPAKPPAVGPKLNKIPFAPNYTGELNAEYTHDLANGMRLSLYGEAVTHGKMYLSINNDPDGLVNPYVLANLRASIETANGQWRVTAYGKNVFDKKYKERLFDLYNNDLVGQKFTVLGDPATYGVEIKYRY
jgi:iron complex outermembrane receptor protein